VGELLALILHSLRGCLCGTLEDAGVPVCRCANYPGAYATADSCSCSSGGGCGQAWVRLDRLYPSKTFPQQDGAPGNCNSTMVAVIEVGVYRCRPTPKGNGAMPSAAEVTESADRETRDAALMAKAITCCDVVTRRPWVLGTWLPRDAADCGGGAWTLTVQLTRAPEDVLP
jgi:hypothetical protein